MLNEVIKLYHDLSKKSIVWFDRFPVKTACVTQNDDMVVSKKGVCRWVGPIRNSWTNFIGKK